MTQIDTREFPNEFWKSGSAYLEAIEFIILKDGNSISLATDEEGNDEIILNKESALWLSEELKRYAEEL